MTLVKGMTFANLAAHPNYTGVSSPGENSTRFEMLYLMFCVFPAEFMSFASSLESLLGWSRVASSLLQSAFLIYSHLVEVIIRLECNLELICTREFFKKYQNLTSPQGELNLNFLKN